MTLIPNGNRARTPILFDHFDGPSIDTTKWVVYDRLSDQINGEVNCVIPANVSLGSSLLSGVSKFEDHSCGDSVQSPITEHYTSWQIAQAGAAFQYGTIEVRAKLPGGTGIWPTIFMLGYLWQPSQAATANDPANNWPVAGWCEVDIAEFLSNARSTVNTQVHFGTANVGPGLKALPFDATSRFMVYRLQWEVGSLVWSVDPEDGGGYQTLSSMSGANVPNVPMYLVINAAIGGTGGGTPDSATFPQTFQIDYVRVVQ